MGDGGVRECGRWESEGVWEMGECERWGSEGVWEMGE